MYSKLNYGELFFLIKQIDLQITQIFESNMDISLTRYEILLHLIKVKSMTQTDLQKQMRINQAAITRHLKILEEKDFAIRKRNPNNNREVLVQISEQGKKVLKSCDINKTKLVDTFFEHYSEEQMTMFIDFLKDLNNQSEVILKDRNS